jgi:hypothetical protein
MYNVIKSEILAHSTSKIDDLLLELFDLLADMDEYLRSFAFLDHSYEEDEYEFRYFTIRKKEREIEALGYFGHRDWLSQN